MIKQKQPYYQDFEENPLDQKYHVIPEDEIETMYLYAYSEDPEQALVWNLDRLIGGLTVFLVLVLLIGLGLAGSVLPSITPFAIQTITVPAQLVTQEVQTSVAIVPMGTRAIPATKATGVLTIYNGSFLAQSLPAGFVLSTQSGIEIMTDEAVTIPAENPATNPPTNGMATVLAHTLLAGASGNIPTGAITAVYGSSLYIKNLTAFAGGRDARMEHYVTERDQAKALARARAQLATEKQHGLQVRPCREIVRQTSLTLAVAWNCQFVHYRLPPSLQVLSIQVAGNRVLVRIQMPLPAVRQIVR